MLYYEFRKVVSVLMIAVLLASCSISPSGPASIDRNLVLSESARMIDQEIERVVRELEVPGEIDGLSDMGTLDGDTVTRGTLSEENGEKYLEFLYMSERFSSVDEVVAVASDIVPKSELDAIVTEADKIEKRLLELYEDDIRALNEKQKAEFYKDIRKIVVKSVVLLTAAIVYALIPNSIVWGKVTAATAVSISAGIAASGFMRLIERKNSDTAAANQTFSDWIQELSTEPTTAWAIAAGIINTGKSLGYNPVTTSIILVVFGIYGIKDDLKPLLEKYNFKV